MGNTSAKYRAALATAERIGWRFTSLMPRSTVLYHAMMLSGMKWNYVDKAWVKWRQPYVVLKESA
jgi:hypothetical protein